ncbi:TPA: DUF3696 domain-containing protein [Streptococcus suis]
MIKSISINNYKSYAKEQTFPLTKLTIVTGENSSGKSSLIESILILGQENQPNIFNAHLKNIGKFTTLKNNSTTFPTITLKFKHENKLQSTIELKSDTKINKNIYNKNNILYLSAERIAVQSIYKSDYKNRSFDSKGEYLISIFENQKDRRDFITKYPHSFSKENWIINDLNLMYYDEKKIDSSDDSFSGKPTLEFLINIWLKKLTGYTVSVKPIENDDFINIVFIKDGKEYYPKHVGTGVSFLLLQLIAIFCSDENDILTIENPEIHLHPKMQSQLMLFYLWSTKLGKQIIIETHSDHIFNSSRLFITKHEDCNILFVKLDNENRSIVHNIIIEDFGIVQNEIEGLFDQYLIDTDKLLGIDQA